MQGLGGFAGPYFLSRAESVSADGSTIVGWSYVDALRKAFRWTESEGMQPLGVLPGSVPASEAYDTHADGSGIVGTAASDEGQAAFVWDAERGMRTVKEILEEAGIDLSGWYLHYAWALSDDGLTVVGDGLNPDSEEEAWVAYLPEPSPLGFLAPGLLLACAGFLLPRRTSQGQSSPAPPARDTCSGLIRSTENFAAFSSMWSRRASGSGALRPRPVKGRRRATTKFLR